MSEAPLLPLLNGTIHIQDVSDEDDNMLPQLRYPQQKKEFWDYLKAHTTEIEALVCYHLGINRCHVCLMEIWKSGSFNVCIPVLVPANSRRGHSRVFVRFPLPYKTGEENYPGNVEEKLRTEIATYIWIEKQCPDVPIPTLHGFGLPDGRCFTHPQNSPLFTRIAGEVRRCILSLLGFPTPCNYVPRRLHNPFKSGYLVLSEAQGKPLHLTWETHRHDKSYRARLFHSLARISLSLNKTPLPQIGSMSLDSHGIITLANRPLNLHFQMLENEGIPTGIPRQRTYTSVEPYISDLLSVQDNKILYQPNAIHDQDDGERQFAALTALRATMHCFIRTEYRNGPFLFTLTDLHQTNIFVDEQWNIQTVIDLEWSCSQPVEMQLPPYWITSKAVDRFQDPESVAELDALFKEYFEIYEEEEEKQNGVVYQAPIMRHAWETGSFWYFQAVTVPKGMYRVFNANIQPLFNKRHSEESIFDQVFWCYWGARAQDVVKKKLKDKEDYLMQVRKAFGADTQHHVEQP